MDNDQITNITPLFPLPELSRAVPIAALSNTMSHFSVEANEVECLALATRFDVTKLVFIKGMLTARLSSDKKRVFVGGQVAARVIQPCVVTMEPVETRIEENIELVFSCEPPEKWPDELDLSEAEENFPEPIQGDRIDFGEIAAQAISLGIPDYPRASEAVFNPEALGLDAPESPFIKLKNLKKTQE